MDATFRISPLRDLFRRSATQWHATVRAELTRFQKALVSPTFQLSQDTSAPLLEPAAVGAALR
jgi:hypothetical protein